MTSITGDLQRIKKEFSEHMQRTASSEELQAVKVAFLGKKSDLASLLKKLGSLPADERPAAGEAVNSLRDFIEGGLVEKKEAIEEEESLAEELKNPLDVTLPARRGGWGQFTRWPS